jgi:hypothetical protein
MNGGVAEAKDGFKSYEQTINIKDVPNGTKITVGLLPYTRPDMLVVTSGTFNKSTGFITTGFGSGTYGEYNPKFQTEVILMTTLYYGFNGQVPEYFNTGIGQLEDKVAYNLVYEMCTNLSPIDQSFTILAIKSIFQHIRDMSFVDKIVKGENEDDAVYESRAIKEFLRMMPLYYNRATSKWYTNVSKTGYGSIELTKEDGMNDVTIRVYSPLPGTQWDVFATCS